MTIKNISNFSILCDLFYLFFVVVTKYIESVGKFECNVCDQLTFIRAFHMMRVKYLKKERIVYFPLCIVVDDNTVIVVISQIQIKFIFYKCVALHVISGFNVTINSGGNILLSLLSATNAFSRYLYIAYIYVFIFVYFLFCFVFFISISKPVNV